MLKNLLTRGFARVNKLRAEPKVETRKSLSEPLKNIKYEGAKLTKSQKIWEAAKIQYHTPGLYEQKPDPKKNFLYGFEPDDFQDRNPLVAKAFSIAQASDSQLLAFRKKSAIQKYQRDLGDTGNPAVQVACLTERIVNMLRHCLHNNSDYITKKQLQILYHRRRKMLNYLRTVDPNSYITVVREYNIQQSQKELDSFQFFRQKHMVGQFRDKNSRFGAQPLNQESSNHMKKEARMRAFEKRTK